MTEADASARALAVQSCLRGLLPGPVAVFCEPVRDAGDTLFAAERGTVARAVRHRRDEFSTGRLLARRALTAIGQPAAAIPADGARRPVWPAGVVGSISHSSGLCAAAVARRDGMRALGLDIERIGAVPAEIMDTISHAGEIAAHRDRFGDDLLRTLLFSAREAIYKAYNPLTGSYLDHRDVVLSLAGNAFTARIVAPDRPRFDGADRIAGVFAEAGGMVVSLVAVPAPSRSG